jgi:bicarbonate transport system substrate-binding protein
LFSCFFIFKEVKMVKFSNQFSRRKFLLTAGASAAGSVLLKGCVGNPAETDRNTTQAQQTPAANISPEQAPETTTAKLGYIPIVESAPLIIAKEKGFFAKYGMSDVQVAKQANWGSARDNVEIGSAGGGIDGGQWQMPMPYQISEGWITKGNRKIPMYVLAQLNTQGNGIAIAGKHQGQGIELKIAQGRDALFSQLKQAGTKFRAAYTFPEANQEFWIRYWLASSGIDPDNDVELLTVPAAQTVANMRTGTMDAFSTGDPWPYRIVKEEYFAMRADWVDKNPKATKALLKGIMEAQQWCDNFDNRQELAQILSGGNYFNVPVEVLIDPFMGKYNMGDGRTIDDRTMATYYWKDEKGSVSYPYKSHDLWFLVESVRWGFIPEDILTNANTLIDRVNREDLWKETARELGIADADIPSNTSRGVEEFFDGIKFDPENPTAYLKSLKIKKVKV